MKCLLILLAFELVTSDKLDRTYLPPPGAKLAGGRQDDLQTPLEFSKETYPGTIQDSQFPGTSQVNTITGSASNQSLDDGMSKSLVPIVTTRYSNDFSQTTSFPTSGYDYTELPLRPDVVSYDSFPPKTSDVGSTYQAKQSYIAPTLNTGFETTSTINDLKRPVASGETPSYYHFVPTGAQTFGNDKINQGLTKVGSSNDQSSALIQYPQSNNGYLSSDRQNFTPKTATAKDIVQNYQPSAFGYYGGNPMIMTYQNSSTQESGSELTPKYDEYEAKLPVMSVNQDKQNFKSRSSVLPFQTPLVGTYAKNPKKSSAAITSDSPPDQLQYPLYKEKMPVGLEKRISVPVHPKLKPERPQTESDRNAVILNYENVISPEGYSYSFDTSNGIHKDESGTATDGVKAKGSYSYTGDDGKIYSITYTADENGFQPRGDHLPTPPPIPEAIKKVIEQAAREKGAGFVDDGSYDEKKYGHMNYQGAMGRYRPFKEGHVSNINQNLNAKFSSLNGAQRENYIENVNNKGINTISVEKGKNSLDSSKKTTDIPLTNKLLSNPVHQQVESRNEMPTQTNKDSLISLRTKSPSMHRRPIFVTNNNQQRVLNDNNAEGKYLGPNIINQTQTKIGPEQKSQNQNDAQERDQKERLTPSVSRYSQNRNDNKTTSNGYFQTQSPDLTYKPNNMNTRVYNQRLANQIPQINPVLNKKLSSNVITSYDNGYFYVPPIGKFQQNKPFDRYSEQPINTQSAYITSDTPIQVVNASVNRRNELDGSQEISRNQEAFDEKQTLIHKPYNRDNIINDSTRKPYISGPNNQGEINLYDDTQIKSLKSDENDRTKLTTYPSDLYSTNYVYTTTPMPPQSPQFVNPASDGYNINQFYQTTINPTSFYQTVPNTVENRLNIPNGTPRISISQDIVTSTYRPGSFSDGINLEVNQNVKIYDVGRPIPTDNIQGYPEQVSTYTDGFYTPTIPNEESRFTGTFSEMYSEGPSLDRKVIQGTNQDVNYGNDLYSTETPLTDNTSPTGYYYPNPGLEKQSYYDTIENHKNPSSIINGFILGEYSTTPTYIIEGISPTERVIGEDFSGPKQPQRYDPETGYHY